MTKIDLHIHTKNSHFWCPKVKDIIKTCIKKKFDFIAITDHNEIENALKGKKLWKNVIIGEEIDTKEGQIIGLFLQEKIKPNKGLLETLDKIKSQDGIYFIPHPLDMRHSLKVKDIKKLKNPLIELNGKVIPNKIEEIKRIFKGYRFIANSDAHHLSQIGNAYNIVKDISNEEELKKVLKNGKIKIIIKKYYIRKITLWKERFEQLKCIFTYKIKEQKR